MLDEATAGLVAALAASPRDAPRPLTGWRGIWAHRRCSSWWRTGRSAPYLPAPGVSADAAGRPPWRDLSRAPGSPGSTGERGLSRRPTRSCAARISCGAGHPPRLHRRQRRAPGHRGACVPLVPLLASHAAARADGAAARGELARGAGPGARGRDPCRARSTRRGREVERTRSAARRAGARTGRGARAGRSRHHGQGRIPGDAGPRAAQSALADPHGAAAAAPEEPDDRGSRTSSSGRSSNLMRLVDDLLDVSRITRGQDRAAEGAHRARGSRGPGHRDGRARCWRGSGRCSTWRFPRAA